MHSAEKMKTVLAQKSRVKKAFTFTDVVGILGVAQKKVVDLAMSMDVKPEPVEGFGGKARAVFSPEQVALLMDKILTNPPTRKYKKRAAAEVDRDLGIVHAIMAVRDEIAKSRVATENLNLRGELVVVQLKRIADLLGSKISPQAIKEIVDGIRKADGSAGTGGEDA